MKFSMHILILFFSHNLFAKEVFRVAVPFLPNKIMPRDGQLNIGQYLSLHLYYPLVSESTQGVWSSEFLNPHKTKATSASFDEFRMCLLEKILFSDGTRIKSTDLKVTLERFHAINEQAPALDKVKLDGSDCVLLKLKKRSPRYFQSLQGTSSTLLKESSEEDVVPIGMGPYRIEIFSESKAVLVAFKEKSFRFNRIIFDKVSDKNFNPSKYEDINPVYGYFASLSKLNFTGFKTVSTNTYKTYAVIVNTLDDNFKNCFAQNLNVQKLIQSYKLSLNFIPGFLPRGMPGHNIKYVKINNCKNNSEFDKINMIIPFKNQYDSLVKDKKAIFGHMEKFISLTLVDPTIMAQKIFQKKPYISIVGFDTSGTNSAFLSEASVYFESFFRENGILIKPIKELEDVIVKVSSIFSKERRVEMFELAHVILLKSGYVVPLGENRAIQIFPKYLSEVVIADPISGYPQIDKIK